MGRDELVVAAETAAQDVGSIVLLTGEAGIGKTSVARIVAQRVGDQLAVSWGACVADQSAPPFWPWHALVAVGPSDPLQAIDQAIGAARFERLTALRDQIRGQVLDQPRLHVIEDLQWAARRARQRTGAHPWQESRSRTSQRRTRSVVLRTPPSRS